MEIVYLILLFVAPGIFIRQLRVYVKKRKPINQPLYEYMFEIVVDSIIVATITVLILTRTIGWNVISINELIEHLMQFDDLAMFTVSAVCISCLWYLVKYRIVEPAALCIKNKYLHHTEHIIHIEESRVWDVLQRMEGINGTWQVVSVYKDGEYLLSGMIDVYSQPQNPEMELTFSHVEKVEELRSSHPELFKTFREYYNCETGLRIKFYFQSIIKEHWEKYFVR